jgi:uncharacterized protein (TIGR03643 family)
MLTDSVEGRVIMGIFSEFKKKISQFSQDEKDRLVRMGWEDRTTFEAIQQQFCLTENEFVRFMRTALPKKDYERWRRRAHEQGHLKHRLKRGFQVTRFKCSRQSVDGLTKGWK